MARPSKPKPDPIEPRTALRRLSGRYGPTAAYDVVQDAPGDVQARKRSGRRDGDDAVVLDALAVLPLVRGQLESIERELLQVGHEELGLTMAQLAPALGVKTRQAAEQRYQRNAVTNTTPEPATTAADNPRNMTTKSGCRTRPLRCPS